MPRIFATALAMAAGLAGVTPAPALQTIFMQVDKNADRSMACHLVVRLAAGKTDRNGKKDAA